MPPPLDWPHSRPIAEQSPQSSGGVIEVEIEGAGLAGQVLHRELRCRGIASRLKDRVEFPREKVCGGVLQWDSWEYLKTWFEIPEPAVPIHSISHFWRGKKISTQTLPRPMVYVPRCELDTALYSQSRPAPASGGGVLRVNAKGIASGAAGKWIGFQGTCGAVEELQMHYGRGVCAGVAPTGASEAHLAFIVKRDRFQNAEALKKYLGCELGLKSEGVLKGTGRLQYGYSREAFAVGDAKMATFPFLGLGMKHAILSARLLAGKIAGNEAALYAQAHRRVFRRWRCFSVLCGALYDSPFQPLFKPLLQNRAVFLGLYGWLHAAKV